jgi:hypothetical protein
MISPNGKTLIQRQSHDIVGLEGYDATSLSSPTPSVRSCRHLVYTPRSSEAVVRDEDIPCYQSDYQAQKTSGMLGQAAIHQKSAAD